jgi:hypothetical protein
MQNYDAKNYEVIPRYWKNVHISGSVNYGL